MEKGEYRFIVDALQEQMRRNVATDVAGGEETKLPGTRKSIVKLLKMETTVD